MATIITGRDVSFILGGAPFDAQATSATLSLELDLQTYQTLDGEAYKVINQTGTFEIEMLADWGATSSLCERLWSDITLNPDLPLAVSLTAKTGAVFTFNAKATNLPQVNGSGNEAQTVSMSFLVEDGAVVGTFT
jgi:hypothetical protein